MIHRTARIVALLVVFSGVPALIAIGFHPELRAGPTPPLAAHEITVAMAQAWEKDVLWADVRPHEHFAHAHVPGAVSLDPTAWEQRLGQLLERWRPGVKVVVYCDAAGCDLSKQISDRLRAEVGLPDVYYLRGGWKAWRDSQR